MYYGSPQKFCISDIKEKDNIRVKLIYVHRNSIIKTVKRYNFGRALLAKDIVSAFLVKLYEIPKDETIQLMIDNEGYMITVLNNFCTDIYKKEKIRRDPSVVLKIARAGRILNERAENDFVNTINTGSRTDSFIEFDFLDPLTIKEKKVLELRQTGYSHKKIAEVLSISVSASKKRFQRAKIKLQKVRASEKSKPNHR